MFNLFKRKKGIPPFDVLEGYSQKDWYFVRSARWYPMGNSMITVIDPHQPRLLTLDPWPQIVFLEADGQRTVSEFVHYLAGKYSSAIPGDLDKAVIGEIVKLADYKIIQLSEERKRPDQPFDEPHKPG